MIDCLYLQQGNTLFPLRRLVWIQKAEQTVFLDMDFQNFTDVDKDRERQFLQPAGDDLYYLEF